MTSAGDGQAAGLRLTTLRSATGLIIDADGERSEQGRLLSLATRANAAPASDLTLIAPRPAEVAALNCPGSFSQVYVDISAREGQAQPIRVDVSDFVVVDDERAVAFPRA